MEYGVWEKPLDGWAVVKVKRNNIFRVPGKGGRIASRRL